MTLILLLTPSPHCYFLIFLRVHHNSFQGTSASLQSLLDMVIVCLPVGWPGWILSFDMIGGRTEQVGLLGQRRARKHSRETLSSLETITRPGYRMGLFLLLLVWFGWRPFPAVLRDDS